MPGGYVKGGYPKDSWKNDIQYVIPGQMVELLTCTHLERMAKKAVKVMMQILLSTLIKM